MDHKANAGPLEHALARLTPRAGTMYTSRGRAVMATGLDGFVCGGDQGLWIYQTRMLSRYRWRVNGAPPQLSAASNLEQERWLGYYIAAPAESGGDAAQQTIELRLEREVGPGLTETVELTNHTQAASRVELELEVASDFADPQEAGGKRQQRGRLRQQWQARAGGGELDFDYRARHVYFHQGDWGRAQIARGLRLGLESPGVTPEHRQGRIRFHVELPPRGQWRARLEWQPRIEGQSIDGRAWSGKRAAFMAVATRFTAAGGGGLSAVVTGALAQATRDLAALRLYDLDREDGGWVPAAGLPVYLALFGRDTIFAGRQAVMLGPEMLAGALEELSRWQARSSDRWRDAEPGRIVHELHTNPLASLNYTPHGRYYGGVTGAIAFGVALAELWYWTGDAERVRPLVATALRGLEWADKYGDRDGSGFCKYRTRSNQGEKNQGWKDSGDAIVWADGSQAADPLGTCEMQALVYASKLHLGSLLGVLGDAKRGRQLRREAAELRQRFNATFWMEAEGYVALGIGVGNRLIRTVASDGGHTLGTGIIVREREARVAERLMAADLFSGWGVRTLSALHPAYNPYAYHRGTVWPVENAILAMGLARCGEVERLQQLARAQFEAAALFEHGRLPELFTGHARDAEHAIPGQYPRANWPQAWSASAVVAQVQALLGVCAYAPGETLLLDPHLPEWLPELTVRGLRVGKATVSVRFERRGGETEFEVVERAGGALRVMRHPEPWRLLERSAAEVAEALQESRAA